MALALGTAACGGTQASSEGVGSQIPPAVVNPMPASASLSGRVHRADGSPVAGASVLIAETDGSVSTGDDGTYSVSVPSESTVTLVASAPGMAPTYRQPVQLTAQASGMGLDILMLSTDEVATLAALSPTNRATTGGVIATRLHALVPSCAPAGATIAVRPPQAAQVVYGHSAVADAVSSPDPALTSVQVGDGDVAGWLVGAVPPGSEIDIAVARDGCRVAVPAPSLGGLTYESGMRVDALALTEMDLFLEEAP